MKNLTDLWLAQNLIMAKVPASLSETISVEQAMGRILAKDIYSPVDLPHFNRSKMDGYCINSEISDYSKPFTVVGEISAADTHDKHLNANEAIKVSTGSPVPEYSTSVVPVENSSKVENKIFLQKQRKDFIDHKGSKVKKHSKIFSKQHTLDHRDLELLASLRVNHIDVYMQPKIGVISTGGEITNLFHSNDFIVNSNFYMLTSLLDKFYIPHNYLGIIPDDKQKIKESLHIASQKYDIITTFGGTGFSRFDLLTSAIEELGGSILINGINASPGKTFKFAMLSGKPVFIFPGTPESATSCAEFFLIPFIKKIFDNNAQKFYFQKTTVRFSLKKKKGFYKIVPGYTFIEMDKIISVDRYSEYFSGTFPAFRSLTIIDKNTESLNKGDICDSLLSYYL
jgi:molybdopterin molybdotransferase